jgi:hypothetical protein
VFKREWFCCYREPAKIKAHCAVLGHGL